MASMFGTLVGDAVDRLVRWVVVPITGVIPVLVRTGMLLVVFGALWLGFGSALVLDPATLDTAWRSIGSQPLVLQAVAWLLFLPLMAGMWVWSTDWPLVVRVALIVTLAGWNLLVFMPRREPASAVAAQ